MRLDFTNRRISLERISKLGFWFHIKADARFIRRRPKEVPLGKYIGISRTQDERPTPIWGQKTFLRCVPGCLLSHVFPVFFAIVLLAGCLSESTGPQYEVFLPAGGKGAVVLAVSGYAGTSYFRDFSSKLAELGYYTLLMDGKDLIDPGRMGAIIPGAENLQTVIAAAKSSPHAIPGKVALVGFSIGGAGVLKYGARLKDQVSAVVAYYPAISITGTISNYAAGLQTPVLLLAGGQDRYQNCCLIASMRELAEAPKAASFELVEYPDAGHCFNLSNTPFTYRPQDAADAWDRTAAFLKRLHSPEGK